MKRMIGSLTELEKEQESKQIAEKISTYVNKSPQIKTIASYACTPSEISLDTLHSTLTELSEIRFCYPRCRPEGKMDFYTVRDLSTMVTSEYGIREPDETIHEQVNPKDIDLFLCPAYAYTKTGERLGKGGGFYDRYLLKKRADATTLGVAFACQIIPHVPTDIHDLLIDHII